MSSSVRKSSRFLNEKELRSRLQTKNVEEHLDEMLDNVSLDEVSLEEIRREARKPLFLTRYE